MLDVAVIDEPATASVLLEPLRAQVIAALTLEPGSATTIATELGVSRQKVNYHLRTLEEHGLVELHEQRQRRGLTERIMVASARSYVLSPVVLGETQPVPERMDHLSSRYLLAVASRLLREVAALIRGARTARKPLATLTIDTEIRFATAQDRARFAQELADTVTHLAARFHDEGAPRGRWHRLVVAAHPTTSPTSQQREEQRV